MRVYFINHNLVMFQGWITVAKGADLDREKQHLIVITARAYDSPNDERVRRYVSVPVSNILFGYLPKDTYE